ncbi:MAG: RsmE family RNA methyltransferase [Cytophagales bacterium]|nr:RsmE family RNA methyltransferase [Cytophagales bacterium]
MHLFYKPDLKENATLEGDEFHHCVKVLRHQAGDVVFMTDGQGAMAKVTIDGISKSALQFSAIERLDQPAKPFGVHLFICPTKNFDRMEWMVEKAAEIQVDEITFINSRNSERPKANLGRLEKKAVSALKQSKSAWKMQINTIQPFDQVIEKLTGESFLAYVEEKQQALKDSISPDKQVNLFIGPEGDFTPEEVALAKAKGIQPVSLGKSVLRTETAGLLACHTVNLMNGF